MAVGLALGLLWPADRPVAATAPEHAAHGSVLYGSWYHDLTIIAEGVVAKFIEVQLILSSAQYATLTPQQQRALDQLLTDVEDAVLDVLDPQVYPSLSVPGLVDTSVAPVSVDDYSLSCTGLAEDALQEIQTGPGFDQHTVASSFATIEHLITRSDPHNFRTVAGLD